MIRVGIIGATGYAGEELVRLLSGHKNVTIAHVVSKSFAGKKLSEIYGNYLCGLDYQLEDLHIDQMAADCDLIFTALPHAASIETIPPLIQRGVKVIDLSGSFRYENADLFEEWYQIKHTERPLLKKAVYGLCEIYAKQIVQASLIGNPGCYTTTSILPVYPLLQEKLVSTENIIIDAKSGVTGAGRNEKLAFSFCESHENFKAYGVTNHRHTSEIEQEYGKAAGREVRVSFTPHLLPVKRGILATIYLNLQNGVTDSQIAAAYMRRYEESKFVHILPEGSLPELKYVVGSNCCMIGYKIDKRLNRLVVISCLDNLVKGAAGQAIQCMNLMFGEKEEEGLPVVANYL